MPEKLIRSGKFKVVETDKHFRVRVRDPVLFVKSSFRTLDGGRKGFTKRIIGRLKGEKDTTVQAVLFVKKDFGREKARKFAISLSKNMKRIDDGEFTGGKKHVTVKKHTRKIKVKGLKAIPVKKHRRRVG